MKKFLNKFFCFISPLIIILFGFFLIPNLALEDDILENSLTSKISEFLIDTNKINIIIAGDSRAERQVIPKIIKEKTGFNAINIATASCDLVTIAAAIKNKYQPNSKFIFLISASSWQINDGAIDPGYLSLKCFSKCTLQEKYMLYKTNIPEMFRLQILLSKHILYRLLRKEYSFKDDENIIKELGFYGIKGRLDTQSKSTVSESLISHPWYKSFNNNGVRWSIFQNALNQIGNMNSYFIIYSAPTSSYWKVISAKSIIDLAEIEYSKKLGVEIQQYNNVLFLDFYNNDIIGLNDSMYYDIQHLNREGAEVFSIFLSNKILDVYQKNFK